MAIKKIVEVQEEHEEQENTNTEVVEAGNTSLAAQIMAGDLLQAKNKSFGTGLPAIRFHWAIQSDLPNLNMFNIWVNNVPEVIQEGTIFTVLANRNCFKFGYINENGESRSKYAYPGGDSAATYAEYQQMYADKKGDVDLAQGVDYLVAVLHEGKWTLATMLVTKSMADYLSFLHTNALFQQKTGQEFKIADHKGNFTKSAKGRGSYPDKKKFTQREKVSLEPSDIASIMALVKENEEAIQTFMTR